VDACGDAVARLRRYRILFWDFDGVIKESVTIKTDAYVALFEPFGPQLAARVREHHECNGGMSRLEKIPLYLRWSGAEPSTEQVDEYCAAFAHAVRQRVIDCPWVAGVREYLAQNHARQRCVLITATPQAEMIDILAALRIAAWFREVHGAPTSKAQAIAAVLQRWRCAPTEALVIGDSRSDYQAALTAGPDFLLRRTPLNRKLQSEFGGPQCENFVDG
jgi:phosphoglycolate phosphatase-like HAD superfamily hydrolase